MAKGNTSCHIPSDKYRKAYDNMTKDCGCKMGEKCGCEAKVIYKTAFGDAPIKREGHGYTEGWE